MKIKVEQEHIDKGQKKSRFSCPIALAVGGADVCMTAKVRDYDMHVYPLRGGKVNYKLPGEASDFIWKFDNDLPVKPFEFEAEEIRE